MSSTRPGVISGKRPATIDVDVLSRRLRGAIKRSKGGPRFKKYGVMFLGWDYDGYSKKGNKKLNFQTISEELEALLRDQYGYETLRIILKADQSESDTRYRNDNAGGQYYRESRDFVRKFDDPESCLIIVYRGHGAVIRTEYEKDNELNPNLTDKWYLEYGNPDGTSLYLASGDWVDPTWVDDGGKPRKLRTEFSFQTHVLWRLKGTKATVGLIMDCCFAGLSALQGNFSLLAACAASEKAKDGERSLVKNVIAVLSEAYEKQQYVTFGGLHGCILSRARRPNKVATMPLWQSNEHKTEQDGSIWFLPQLEEEDEDAAQASVETSKQIAALSIKEKVDRNLKLQKKAKAKRAKAVRQNDRNKENEALNRDTLPGASVIITSHLKTWSDEATAEFVSMLEAYPESKSVIGTKVEVKWGEITNVFEGSFWVEFSLDARVFHELQEHDAIIWHSGPFEPVYSRTLANRFTRSVSNGLVPAVQDFADVVGRQFHSRSSGAPYKPFHSAADTSKLKENQQPVSAVPKTLMGSLKMRRLRSDAVSAGSAANPTSRPESQDMENFGYELLPRSGR